MTKGSLQARRRFPAVEGTKMVTKKDIGRDARFHGSDLYRTLTGVLVDIKRGFGTIMYRTATTIDGQIHYAPRGEEWTAIVPVKKINVW
jgi:hypothetical protein